MMLSFATHDIERVLLLIVSIVLSFLASFAVPVIYDDPGNTQFEWDAKANDYYQVNGEPYSIWGSRYEGDACEVSVMTRKAMIVGTYVGLGGLVACVALQVPMVWVPALTLMPWHMGSTLFCLWVAVLGLLETMAMVLTLYYATLCEDPALAEGGATLGPAVGMLPVAAFTAIYAGLRCPMEPEQRVSLTRIATRVFMFVGAALLAYVGVMVVPIFRDAHSDDVLKIVRLKSIRGCAERGTAVDTLVLMGKITVGVCALPAVAQVPMVCAQWLAEARWHMALTVCLVGASAIMLLTTWGLGLTVYHFECGYRPHVPSRLSVDPAFSLGPAMIVLPAAGLAMFCAALFDPVTTPALLLTPPNSPPFEDTDNVARQATSTVRRSTRARQTPLVTE